MLRWKQAWTSTLRYKHNHPLKGSHLISDSHDQITNISQLKSICDINGFKEAFMIYIEDYNANKNFLKLPYVSPHVALQTNRFNSHEHYVQINKVDVKVVNYKTVNDKYLRTMDSLFFGYSKSFIQHEIFCGLIGPESARYVPQPQVVSTNIFFQTTEVHHLNNKAICLNNTHHWALLSEFGEIDWVIDEIL